MKHNNFSYLMREGMRGILKHGFMSFAAVCITVACLVIVSSFGLIAYNFGIMIEDMQDENRILVLIDESFTQAEAKSVGSQINLLDNIKDVEFVSREKALENFTKDYDEALYAGLDADTMRDQFIVMLEDNGKIDETIVALQQISGVAKINAKAEVAKTMATIRDVLNVAATAITAVLLVVSLVIISNTIKLTMFDRREEIAIMKMVGATNSFIRLPFIVEGFSLGLIGGLFGFFIEWGLYDSLRVAIHNTGALDFITIVPFTDVIWVMALLCAVSGFIIGVLGSLLSIRKFLKV